MSSFRPIVTVVVFLFAVPAFSADIPALIDECDACHGVDGVSTEKDIPSLAGENVDVLYEALEAFYFYERHCPTTTYRHGDRPKTPLNMCNVANTLSEEDKHTLARHYANQ